MISCCGPRPRRKEEGGTRDHHIVLEKKRRTCTSTAFPKNVSFSLTSKRIYLSIFVIVVTAKFLCARKRVFHLLAKLSLQKTIFAFGLAFCYSPSVSYLGFLCRSFSLSLRPFLSCVLLFLLCHENKLCSFLFLFLQFRKMRNKWSLSRRGEGMRKRERHTHTQKKQPASEL